MVRNSIMFIYIYIYIYIYEISLYKYNKIYFSKREQREQNVFY